MQRYTFLVVALLSMCATVCSGQYFNFSQLQFTPDRVNPGGLLRENQAVIRAVHRNAPTEVGNPIQTSYFAAAYPLMKGKNERFGAIGITALHDRVGANGMFRNNEIGVGYSQAIRLQKNQFLNLGFQGIYSSKRATLNDYETESQLITGQGIDPLLLQGENLIDGFNTDIFQLSAGIFWQATDGAGQEKAHLGLALFNLNRPNASFAQGQDIVPVTWQLSGSYRFELRPQFYATPELLGTLGNGTPQINVGTALGYELNEGDAVEIHGRYLNEHSVQWGIQFHRLNYSVGAVMLSPTGDRRRPFDQAQEFGLVLKKEVEGKKRNRKKRKRKRNKTVTGEQQTVKPKGSPTPPKKEETPRHPEKKEVEERIPVLPKERTPATPSVTVIPFGFNQVRLPNEAAAQQLDKIYRAAAALPDYEIVIVGHTDALGAAAINEKISLARAQQVAAYLIGKGMPKEKIRVEGAGESQPTATNATPEGRGQNRRVEIVLKER